MYDFSSIERQMLGALFGESGWLTIACMVCFFQLVLFRPDRIRSQGMFFWAVLMLAASIVAPVCTMGVLMIVGPLLDSSADQGMIIGFITRLGTPALTALSFILAMMAILPRRTRRMAPAIPNTVHPLD